MLLLLILCCLPALFAFLERPSRAELTITSLMTAHVHETLHNYAVADALAASEEEFKQKVAQVKWSWNSLRAFVKKYFTVITDYGADVNVDDSLNSIASRLGINCKDGDAMLLLALDFRKAIEAFLLGNRQGDYVCVVATQYFVLERPLDSLWKEQRLSFAEIAIVELDSFLIQTSSLLYASHLIIKVRHVNYDLLDSLKKMKNSGIRAAQFKLDLSSMAECDLDLLSSLFAYLDSWNVFSALYTWKNDEFTKEISEHLSKTRLFSLNVMIGVDGDFSGELNNFLKIPTLSQLTLIHKSADYNLITLSAVMKNHQLSRILLSSKFFAEEQESANVLDFSQILCNVAQNNLIEGKRKIENTFTVQERHALYGLLYHFFMEISNVVDVVAKSEEELKEQLKFQLVQNRIENYFKTVLSRICDELLLIQEYGFIDKIIANPERVFKELFELDDVVLQVNKIFFAMAKLLNESALTIIHCPHNPSEFQKIIATPFLLKKMDSQELFDLMASRLKFSMIAHVDFFDDWIRLSSSHVMETKLLFLDLTNTRNLDLSKVFADSSPSAVQSKISAEKVIVIADNHEEVVWDYLNRCTLDYNPLPLWGASLDLKSENMDLIKCLLQYLSIRDFYYNDFKDIDSLFEFMKSIQFLNFSCPQLLYKFYYFVNESLEKPFYKIILPAQDVSMWRNQDCLKVCYEVEGGDALVILGHYDASRYCKVATRE